MTLPEEILKSRLKNEISACRLATKATIEISDEGLDSFPLDLDITFNHLPGPVYEGGRVTYRYTHSFRMIIGREYPFEKPLVIWKTPIFHPNIMQPDDGGHVCTRLLSEWNFNSSLLSFLKGIESLLLSPNGSSPFGTDSCTMAAEHFNKEGLKAAPVAKTVQPRVIR
ncbi:MAG: ubiquitin-conjugating enzyme E2 [Euryarchaeota archaeon]|nr:ubiquitin-conjugating enzyme E2 [Euryarchaeota archaeon]